MCAIFDYIPATTCDNDDAIYGCLQCGRCGRVFENGVMVSDGGTHNKDDSEELGVDL